MLYLCTNFDAIPFKNGRIVPQRAQNYLLPSLLVRSYITGVSGCMGVLLPMLYLCTNFDAILFKNGRIVPGRDPEHLISAAPFTPHTPKKDLYLISPRHPPRTLQDRFAFVRSTVSNLVKLLLVSEVDALIIGPVESRCNELCQGYWMFGDNFCKNMLNAM